LRNECELKSGLKLGQVIETAVGTMTEEKLILGILWEGDLELHTNKELMSKSSFGERIVHGDTVTTLMTSLFLQTQPISTFNWRIKQVSCSFLRPVYIYDEIMGRYTLTKIESDDHYSFEYQVINKNDEMVSSGTITIAKGIENET
jgi:acyl dehydratase